MELLTSNYFLTVGILPQKSDTGIHTQMEVHDRHILVRFFSEMPKVETALVSELMVTLTVPHLERDWSTPQNSW